MIISKNVLWSTKSLSSATHNKDVWLRRKNHTRGKKNDFELKTAFEDARFVFSLMN